MFTVRPFDNRTLSWWYQERDNIDMEPVYQRRSGLWEDYEKAFLIDSILNHFDIPKIYIADFTYVDTPLNETRKQFAVIDGRQRFEAIFDFFDGRIVLNQNFIYSDEPSLHLSRLGYKDLKQNYPKVASNFENFNLSVVSVITDEEAKISELFVRLNSSKPLTGAEIRNAMSGKVPAIARAIVDHDFFGSRIRFQVKRGQDLNAATKMLITEFGGAFVDTKKVNLDRFVQEGLRTESHDLDRAAARVYRVLDQMTNIFVLRDSVLSSQGLLTVYYWLVRNLAEQHRGIIREFLLEFERKRQENRDMAKTNPMLADQELLLYDSLNRSTNDQRSLEGRYAILLNSFWGFRETGNIKGPPLLEATR